MDTLPLTLRWHPRPSACEKLRFRGHQRIRLGARGIIREGRTDLEEVRTAAIGGTLGRIGLFAVDKFVGDVTFDRIGPVQSEKFRFRKVSAAFGASLDQH